MPNAISDTSSFTPLDREVIDSFSERLRTAGIAEPTIATLTASYQAARAPSADALLAILKQAVAAPEEAE